MGYQRKGNERSISCWWSGHIDSMIGGEYPGAPELPAFDRMRRLMLSPAHRFAVFTEAECDRIIAVADEAAFADAGLVHGEQIESIRRARITWLDETGSADWIFRRILDTVAEVNREHFGFELTEFAERMQVAWYDGQAGGHFDWHSDIGDGRFAARRKLTIVVQLSDPATYSGGLLQTNGDGRVRNAETLRGSATIFPSFVLHRVTPVTAGARYSLTTWVHGPDFR